MIQNRGLVKNKIFIFILLLFISVILFSIRNVYEPDTFWHIKLGEIIAREHIIPVSDHFSFTKQGIKYINSEWLAELIFYFVYNLSGWDGLIIFKALLISSAFSILFLAMSYLCQFPAAIYFYLLFIAYASKFRFTERPHIFTFFFLSLLILFLVRYYKKKDRMIWVSPFLFLAWANIHAGFIFGLFLLFAACAGEFFQLLFQRYYRDEKVDLRIFFELFAILVLSSAISLINPAHYKIYIFFLQQGGVHEYINIYEYLPIDPVKLPSATIMVLVAIALIFYNWKNITPAFFLPSLLFCWTPFFYSRLAVKFLLISSPAAIESIATILDELKTATRLRGRFFKGAVFTLSALIPAVSFYWMVRTDYMHFISFGRSRLFYPESALNFIMSNELYGNWYNSINFGGAIIFHGYPDIKPFFYTKNEFFQDLIINNSESIKNPDSFSKFINQFNLTGALLETTGRNAGMLSLGMFDKSRWALVFWDDTSAVLVRRDAVSSQFIAKNEFRYINPENVYEYVKLRLNEGGLTDEEINEIKKAVLLAPDSSKAHLVYGMVLAKGDKFEEAEKELQMAVKIQPNSLSANLELADFYWKAGRKQEAAKLYKKSLRLSRAYKSPEGVRKIIEDKIKSLT